MYVLVPQFPQVIPSIGDLLMTSTGQDSAYSRSRDLQVDESASPPLLDQSRFAARLFGQSWRFYAGQFPLRLEDTSRHNTMDAAIPNAPLLVRYFPIQAIAATYSWNSRTWSRTTHCTMHSVQNLDYLHQAEWPQMDQADGHGNCTLHHGVCGMPWSFGLSGRHDDRLCGESGFPSAYLHTAYRQLCYFLRQHSILTSTSSYH